MISTDQIVERAVALKQHFGIGQSSAPEKNSLTARSLMKGIIAGMVGGIVATGVKTLGEKFYPPRTHGEPEPTDVLTEKLSGSSLQGSSKAMAAETIHWGFGAFTGAAYGALAEFYPAATAKEGASFGLTLMALTHESALPALGLSAGTEDQTTREHASEMVTHVLFGVTTEVVRSLVRKLLG